MAKKQSSLSQQPDRSDAVQNIKYDPRPSMLMNAHAALESVFFDTLDPRRKQERRDSREVREDRSAMANLSNTPIHREWQKDRIYMSPFIDPGVERE